MKKKKEKKREDFYSRLVIPTGSKGVCKATGPADSLLPVGIINRE
jgi:hypothetical protein